MNEKIGVFYGSTTCYTEIAAEKICGDTFRQHYNVALLKFIVMIIFATVLNILCSRNLSIIAWLLVFIPFIFMTVITTLLLIAFGLDPKLKSKKKEEQKKSESTSTTNKRKSIAVKAARAMGKVVGKVAKKLSK